MDNKNLVTAITETLNGIDETDIDSVYGWWETSTGAEFGSEKLKEIIRLILDSEWQPIKSAPKDGSVIDLWHKNGFRLTDVWWDDEDEVWTCLLPDVDFTHWKQITEPSPP